MKIRRYKDLDSVPSRLKLSGYTYRRYQVKETKVSAENKVERLREAETAARVVPFRIKGSAKMYYAVFKRGRL